MKALSGCDEPTQEPVWEDGDGNRFYSCPLLFVPETVSHWYEEYAYAREFGTMIDFMDRPARWLDAMRVYTSECTKHHDEKMAKIKQETQVKRSSR